MLARVGPALPPSLTTSSPGRVRLSKRRAKAGVQSGTNAVLVVKHRDMNEKELEAQVGLGVLVGRGGLWEGGSLELSGPLGHLCFPRRKPAKPSWRTTNPRRRKRRRWTWAKRRKAQVGGLSPRSRPAPESRAGPRPALRLFLSGPLEVSRQLEIKCK